MIYLELLMIYLDNMNEIFGLYSWGINDIISDDIYIYIFNYIYILQIF